MGTAPIGVHSRWDNAKKYCELSIFTDKKEAEVFLKDLPPQEAEVFNKVAAKLAQLPGGKPLKFESGLAATLSNCLIAYSMCSHPFPVAYPEDLLCGFWEPAPEEPVRKGMLMWREPQEGSYAVLITESREHALNAVKALYWMGEGRQKDLSEKIESWNLLSDLKKDAIHIEGPVAELLCHASIYKQLASMQMARRARMN